MKNKSNNFIILFILMICTMLSLAATDLILPAIPEMPSIFGTNESNSQLILVFYSLGAACGLLIFGTLGDKYPKKWILTISLIFFSTTSLVGAFVESIDALISTRFFQGVFSSAAPVYTPSIIRQLLNERKSVKAISLLGSIESISPALAPIAGAFLLAYFGWNSSFILLAIIGIPGAIVLCKVTIPEIASKARGSYFNLIKDKTYMRYALSQSMTLGGLLTFVFSAPAIIINNMGGEVNDFILMQAVNVITFIIGANIATRLFVRVNAEKIIFIGSFLAMISALLILLFGIALVTSEYRFIILIIIFIPMGFGLGLRGPLGFYKGVVASGNDSSRGAALIVFFALCATAGGTGIMAPFISDGIVPLAICVLVMHFSSVALLAMLPSMPSNSSD